MLLQGKCKGSAQIHAKTRWEMRLKASEGYWQLFGKCPKRIGDLFSSGYKVSETLSPYKSGDPMGAFPSGSPANKKQGNPLILMLTMYPHI